MKRRCQVCGRRYDPTHELNEYAEGRTKRLDLGWEFGGELPWLRCYTCWVDCLFGIFGGPMEPAIVLNGVRYGAGWSAPVEGGGVNIPF